MGDTFGGEHHRPRSPQRGRSMRQLQDRASYDNEPQVSYGGCLLVATICVTAATTAARLIRK